MANLDDSASWDGIYQLERTDTVDAGAAGDGKANMQAKQLAKRTRWLRDVHEALAQAVGTLDGDVDTLGDAVLAQAQALSTLADETQDSLNALQDNIKPVLQLWEPGLLATPAVFTTVAEGFAPAVISNGGTTVVGDPGSFTSSAVADLAGSAETGFVFTVDPADIPDEADGAVFVGFADGISPSAGITTVAAVSLYTSSGDVYVQLINPLTEQGGAAVPISITAATELAFTLAHNAGTTTFRLYTDAAPGVAAASWVAEDGGSPIDMSTLDRLMFYPAAADAVTVNLVLEPAAAFVYEAITARSAIDPASYPNGRAGQAYELVLADDAWFDALNTSVSHGDAIAFDNNDNPLGFVITPEGVYLTPDQAAEQFQPFVKINYDGYGEPGANNDETEGYSKGSKWYDNNASPRTVWVCVDPYEGYAVWQEITNSYDDLGTMAFADAGTGASQYRQNSENDARFVGRTADASRVYGTDGVGSPLLYLVDAGAPGENRVPLRDGTGNLPLPTQAIANNTPGSALAVSAAYMRGYVKRQAVGVHKIRGLPSKTITVDDKTSSHVYSLGSAGTFVLGLTDLFEVNHPDVSIEIINVSNNSSDVTFEIRESSLGTLIETYTIPFGKRFQIFITLDQDTPYYERKSAILSDVSVATPI